MIVTIGLGIIAFIFLALALKLDEKHFFIKILSLFFCVLSMLAISSHVLNNQQHCEILANYTNNVYVYGANFTGYHWDYDYDLNPAQAPTYALFHVKEYPTYNRYCFDTDEASGLSAFKLVNYFLRILLVYMFVYLIYWLFDYWGINLLKKVEDLFRR